MQAEVTLCFIAALTDLTASRQHLMEHVTVSNYHDLLLSNSLLYVSMYDFLQYMRPRVYKVFQYRPFQTFGRVPSMQASCAICMHKADINMVAGIAMRLVKLTMRCDFAMATRASCCHMQAKRELLRGLALLWGLEESHSSSLAMTKPGLQVAALGLYILPGPLGLQAARLWTVSG